MRGVPYVVDVLAVGESNGVLGFYEIALPRATKISRTVPTARWGKPRGFLRSKNQEEISKTVYQVITRVISLLMTH